jgi:hypothetical protein
MRAAPEQEHHVTSSPTSVARRMVMPGQRGWAERKARPDAPGDSAHLNIIVGVDEEIERAALLEQRQESDRGGDLSDDGLDLPHHLLLRLVHTAAIQSRCVGVHVEHPAFERLARRNGTHLNPLRNKGGPLDTL